MAQGKDKKAWNWALRNFKHLIGWYFPHNWNLIVRQISVILWTSEVSESRLVQFSCSVQFSSVQFVTPWTAAHQASTPSPTPRAYSNSCPLSQLSSFNHLILCHPLLLPPSIFPSIRIFSSESVLPIRWPKYRSFSFSISPSNEYSGLISFRMDWLDLLAVQGTLKSLLQHHSSKASILQQLAFFIIHTWLMEKQ